MEPRANHFVVGLFVLALIAGLVFFVTWLGRTDFDQELAYYKILFRGSVAGLRDGSAVRYRGIPVGQVTSLRIDPENVEQVEVVIQVMGGTPVKKDAEASLEVQGLTGTAYVHLIGGTQDSPTLEPTSPGELPVIRSRPSQLEQVFESAPELLSRLIVLIERANLLLDEPNLQAVETTLANMERFSGALAARSEDVDRLIGEGAGTVVELRKTAESLRALSDELRGRFDVLAEDLEAALEATRVSIESVSVGVRTVSAELGPAVGDIRKAAQSSARAADAIETFLVDNRKPIRDFSSTGLYELSQLVVEVRILVAGLTRLAAKMESDPARFLFGDQSRVGHDAQ